MINGSKPLIGIYKAVSLRHVIQASPSCPEKNENRVRLYALVPN